MIIAWIGSILVIRKIWSESSLVVCWWYAYHSKTLLADLVRIIKISAESLEDVAC